MKFDSLNRESLREKYGVDVLLFLDYIDVEITPYKDMVACLFHEHEFFEEKFNFRKNQINGDSTLINVIVHILLLKQYELCSRAISSLILSNYMVCITLIRSMFESNMVMTYLWMNPEKSEDFVTFSEIIGNPDIDWKSKGISRTKQDKLNKMFSVRNLIRLVYVDSNNDENRINTEHFYQQLCNVTHPSLEPVSMFYKPDFPPVNTFSSIGIRRTISQLFGVINSSNEILSASVVKSDMEIQQCHKRKTKVHDLHIKATKWHKNNPDSLPKYCINGEFKIGWKDGKAVISLLGNKA